MSETEDAMIDKVAMAISGIGGFFLSTRQCFDLARAAIEAMREPTSAMLLAGNKELDCAREKQCWQAMIEAALAEPSDVLKD